MDGFLLDTNHLSPLVTLDHPLRKEILTRRNRGTNFAICVPVLAEMLFGISVLPRSQQNREEWRRLQPLFPCIPLDAEDAEMAADLQITLRRKGRQLAVMNALIATVALRYNLTLLTTDRDFEAVPALKTQNWIQSLRQSTKP